MFGFGNKDWIKAGVNCLMHKMVTVNLNQLPTDETDATGVKHLDKRC